MKALRYLAIIVLTFGGICLYWSYTEMNMASLNQDNEKLLSVRPAIIWGLCSIFVGINIFFPRKWNWFIALLYFLVTFFLSLFFPFFLDYSSSFAPGLGFIFAYFIFGPALLWGVIMSVIAITLLVNNKSIFFNSQIKKATKIQKK